jgi:hypothetical protein
VAPDGTIVAVGSVETAGNSDLWMTKLSAAGDVEWEVVWDGDNNEDDAASHVYVSPDGIIAALVHIGEPPDPEYGDAQSVHVFRYGPDGTLLNRWPLEHATHGIAAGPDGTVISAGWTSGECVITKWDSTGSTIWSYRHADEFVMCGRAVTDADGFIYVVGIRQWADQEDAIWVAKIAP